MQIAATMLCEAWSSSDCVQGTPLGAEVREQQQRAGHVLGPTKVQSVSGVLFQCHSVQTDSCKFADGLGSLCYNQIF